MIELRWTWLLLLAGPATAHAQAAAPCPRSDSAFALVAADTARGFHLPALTAAALPPREFRGRAEVHLLVTPAGRVMPDSTKISGVSSREDSLRLAASAAGFRFKGATYLSCGISAWFVYRVTH